jgi:1-acyl-sn-glycerol-3-phosphate acyltransferase
VVLAVNHFSHLDVIVATHLAGRNVRYLAVDELFGESRFFDRLVGYFGAIPMSRERPPLGALRTALEILSEGGAVGLFPEGRRVAHWGESVAREGAAWLALRAGVPLVPVSIIGTEETLSVRERAMRRASIRAWADPPLYPDDFRDDSNPRLAMTQAWQAAVDHRVAHWSSPR